MGNFSLEELRELKEKKAKLNRQEKIKVNREGKLIDPNSPEKGTTMKPHTWYTPWWEHLPGRLILDQQIMNESFPGFSLYNEEDRLVWKGELTSNTDVKYEVWVTYPDNYPEEELRAFILDPDVSNCPKHIYKDGHLCLWYPSDRTYQSKTTPATVLGITSAWIFCYEEFQRSGEWPGPEQEH